MNLWLCQILNNLITNKYGFSVYPLEVIHDDYFSITIPLLFLCYRSLIKTQKQGTIGYGQFFAMIVFTFFSNFLYYLFYRSFFFLIIDFAIKLGIVFMPQSINASLEQKIAYMHFQILLEKGRSHLIERFYLAHEFIIQWAVSKMDQVEQKHFKNAIISQLQKSTEILPTQREKVGGFASELQNAYKHYQNIGVQCKIITLQMVKNAQHKTQKLQLSKYLNERKAETFSSPPKQTKTENKLSELEDVNLKKKGSLLMKKSSTQLFEDFQDKKPINQSIKRLEVPPIKKSREKSQEYLRRKTQQPSIRKDSVIESEEPFMILNKLDASEYSDLFQEQENDERKLLCKVEAIVQIGQSTNIRLQIYNLELYSNDDLRIVSLYGRQFQKYKLISMKVQKHGYYELGLSGGNFDRRRVKFRGQMDAFKKYIKDQ